MADMFNTAMFKDSFKLIFQADDKGDLNMAFNATLEVQMSRELKVCGAIGHLSTLDKKSPSVSETVLGIGGTNAWKIPSLDRQSSIGLYFEVVNQAANPQPPGQRGLIQLLTHYQNPKGQKILRITTVARPWAEMNATPSAFIPSFDQETATVLMARIAVFKSESEESPDVLRWIDRMLIRLCNRFGDYRKDEPNSFKLSPYLALYPQFMFHLRRSHLMQVFNSSPDETTFYRYMLFRETATNSLTMIQPTLDAYSFNGPPSPVLLAASNILPDRILLLDTFFQVLIFYGQNIADWRNKNYHEDPNYGHFKQLLEMPRADACELIKDRFPQPRYIECDQHSSPSRFLLAIVDPDVNYNQNNFGGGGVDVLTDDVNFHVFLEYLKKLAVQSN